jgi:hypothetical protein
MKEQGCIPIEVPSLIEFRDYDLVVRCLELVRKHVSDFAPECQSWDIRIIALCHHHPSNIYPALGVYDAGTATYEDIMRFGERADDWVMKQPLGWLLNESAKVDVVPWNVLRSEGQAKSDNDTSTAP